jgi:hypothetical protein
MLQRYLFDGLCRLRGRLQKRICNDPEYIARALCVKGVEHKYVGCAIAVLIMCGFLIPSNEQLDFAEQSRVEEKRAEESRERLAAASALETKAKTKTSPIECEFNPFTYESEIVSKSGRVFNPVEVKRILQFHLSSGDPFWKSRIHSVGNLRSNIDTMDGQVPSDWIPPVPQPLKTRCVAAPTCPLCRGTGTKRVPNPSGEGFISVPCDCPKREEVLINHVWVERTKECT